MQWIIKSKQQKIPVQSIIFPQVGQIVNFAISINSLMHKKAKKYELKQKHDHLYHYWNRYQIHKSISMTCESFWFII